MTLFRDEQRKFSLARTLTALWSALCMAVVIYELTSKTHYSVNNVTWAFLSTIELALIAWAGGPRIAQYIAPQIGTAIGSISAAIRSKAAGDETSTNNPKS
jgi:hypothetical protein